MTSSKILQLFWDLTTSSECINSKSYVTIYSRALRDVKWRSWYPNGLMSRGITRPDWPVRRPQDVLQLWRYGLSDVCTYGRRYRVTYRDRIGTTYVPHYSQPLTRHIPGVALRIRGTSSMSMTMQTLRATSWLSVCAGNMRQKYCKLRVFDIYLLIHRIHACVVGSTEGKHRGIVCHETMHGSEEGKRWRGPITPESQ